MKNYCIDCEKEISRLAKRCAVCSHKGVRNPFYGEHHSNKTKMKISKKNKGKLVGENNPAKRPEVREKISKSRKGKKRPPFSKEWKRNMSKSHIGISSWNKDIPHSEKTKKKISDTLKKRENFIYSTPEAIQRSLRNSHGKKCYYDNEFFPSLSEKDCYIKLKELGFKVKHNFLNRFDFLINDKIVVEFHSFDFKLTDKQYYTKRRKLLNEYGYKDLKLIVIKDLKEIEVLGKIC